MVAYLKVSGHNGGLPAPDGAIYDRRSLNGSIAPLPQLWAIVRLLVSAAAEAGLPLGSSLALPLGPAKRSRVEEQFCM